MADPDDYWTRMAIAGHAVLRIAFPVAGVAVCVVAIVMWCPWRRIRLSTLGGVTTLTRRLNYPCTVCQESMEAGEKVRTLSCDHAFHCGGGAKCERGVDQWLLTQAMACPLCRKIPLPVLPGKQPPPSSPAPSPSASEPALQQLPRTSSETQDLEKALLLPAHDETLAEASSSASAPRPPLAQTQLPRTSTPDVAGVLPLPAGDEILPDASSSQ